MSKILIISGDTRYAESLRDNLVEKDFNVKIALQAAIGLIIVREWRPDLILLDISMPVIEGWETYAHIRMIAPNMPVILLGLDGAEDIGRGLGLGAADCLAKSIDLMELTIRVQAALRRRDASRGPLYKNGDLVIDLETHQVEVQGKDVELTATEYKLLSLLIDQENKVVTRRFIADHLFEDDRVRSAAFNQIKVYIGYLRRKLDPDRKGLIIAQRGIGYRLVRTR